MSALLGVVGAVLLGAATVPQAIRLWRTRSAEGLAWGFIVLNLAGLVLLSLRSAEIREWAFLGVNALACGFWLLALVVKAAEERPFARREAGRALGDAKGEKSRTGAGAPGR